MAHRHTDHQGPVILGAASGTPSGLKIRLLNRIEIPERQILHDRWPRGALAGARRQHSRPGSDPVRRDQRDARGTSRPIGTSRSRKGRSATARPAPGARSGAPVARLACCDGHRVGVGIAEGALGRGGPEPHDSGHEHATAPSRSPAQHPSRSRRFCPRTGAPGYRVTLRELAFANTAGPLASDRLPSMPVPARSLWPLTMNELAAGALLCDVVLPTVGLVEDAIAGAPRKVTKPPGGAVIAIVRCRPRCSTPSASLAR